MNKRAGHDLNEGPTEVEESASIKDVLEHISFQVSPDTTK